MCSSMWRHCVCLKSWVPLGGQGGVRCRPELDVWTCGAFIGTRVGVSFSHHKTDLSVVASYGWAAGIFPTLCAAGCVHDGLLQANIFRWCSPHLMAIASVVCRLQQRSREPDSVSRISGVACSAAARAGGDGSSASGSNSGGGVSGGYSGERFTAFVSSPSRASFTAVNSVALIWTNR